jgi:hypothetical protein
MPKLSGNFAALMNNIAVLTTICIVVGLTHSLWSLLLLLAMDPTSTESFSDEE